VKVTTRVVLPAGAFHDGGVVFEHGLDRLVYLRAVVSHYHVVHIPARAVVHVKASSGVVENETGSLWFFEHQVIRSDPDQADDE